MRQKIQQSPECIKCKATPKTKIAKKAQPGKANENPEQERSQKTQQIPKKMKSSRKKKGKPKTTRQQTTTPENKNGKNENSPVTSL